MFGFDLKTFGKESRENYLAAESFPHIIIDNFFSDETFEKLMEEFVIMGHMGDFPYDAQYGKRAKFDDFSPLVESVFLAMEGEPFTKFLEDLTGIDPVLSDPDRFGAGVHSTRRGGFLRRHLDFTKKSADDKLWRRINLIIFMNHDWEEEWGGHCSLSTPDKKIFNNVLPVANRAVLFSTSSKSWHGQVEPLNCPDNRHRISLTCYYYSDTKADKDQHYRSTLYEE